MIWTWLKWVLMWVFRMLVPNPYPSPRKISKDRACTVCGNQGGMLRFEWYRPAGQAEKKPMVFHQCSTCGFTEAFEPVGIPTHVVDFGFQVPDQAKAAKA